MPARSRDAILALDLGTSSLKALMVDRLGAVRARATAAYPTRHPVPEWDEQGIDDWLDAAIVASDAARAAASDLEVVALSVTGQMHGTVLLDRDGEPLTDAVIWSDRRAMNEAAEIADRFGPTLATTIGGPLGPGFMAATLVWMTRHRADLIDGLETALLPKDAFIHALTGFQATDPSDAAGTGLFDAEHGHWHDGIIEMCGLDRRWMPLVMPTGTPIVPLTHDAGAALDLPTGIPVVVGGGDAPAAALGAGIASPSQTLIVLSTGAQVIRPSLSYDPDPAGRWHTWPSATGDPAWNRIGAILNAGRAIGWALDLVARGHRADIQQASAAIAPGADGLVFLPYLAGERCPVADPNARGALLGLTERHDAAHVIRAVYEGAALSIVHAFDVMTEDTGPGNEITLGGGGARNRAWCQIFADILDRPVRISGVADLSALGAARVAARTLGWSSPSPMTGNDTASVLYPESRNVDAYAGLREQFPAISAAARELGHLLP